MTMTNEKRQEWAKYIYGLLGCDYWENLSTGAICYLEKAEKNKNTAENDFLQDLAELDVSICCEYWNKQPLQDIAKHWLKIDSKFRGYDPINSALMCVIFNKMYGERYDCNKYHLVRFYAEFGIIPDLDTFNQIKGENVGGWMNAWDNPQKVFNAYKSLTTEIIHPSRKETQELWEQDAKAEQLKLW